MARKVRLNMIVSAQVAGLMDDIADEEGCTRTEVVRRGLSVLAAFKQQRTIGRTHLGFVSDRTKLDAEIVGILTDFGK